MKNAHDIIRGPVLTEKSYDQIPLKKYSFEVAIDANKVEITKVAKVNTMNVLGKVKRMGRNEGYTPDRKKAVVILKEDSKPIEFFESMVR